jgi:hypothetical protein
MNQALAGSVNSDMRCKVHEYSNVVVNGSHRLQYCKSHAKQREGLRVLLVAVADETSTMPEIACLSSECVE